jgi:hypothetical protein
MIYSVGRIPASSSTPNHSNATADCCTQGRTAGNGADAQSDERSPRAAAKNLALTASLLGVIARVGIANGG